MSKVLTGGRKSDAPEEDKVEPRLDQEAAAEDNPVHEPGRELRRIRRLEGLVRCEYGEEKGRDGAMVECDELADAPIVCDAIAGCDAMAGQQLTIAAWQRCRT